MHSNFVFPELPVTSLSLACRSGEYAEGLLVHGKPWEKNYRICTLSLINRSSEMSIQDIELFLLLPGAVVAAEIDGSSRGMSAAPSLSAFSMPLEVSDGEEIESIISGVGNNITVTEPALAAQGHIALRIVMEPKDELTNSGLADLKYAYHGWRNKRMSARRIHPLKYEGVSLLIDESRKLAISHPRKLMFYDLRGSNLSSFGVDLIEGNDAQLRPTSTPKQPH
jgi:hypothetical protein